MSFSVLYSNLYWFATQFYFYWCNLTSSINVRANLYIIGIRLYFLHIYVHVTINLLAYTYMNTISCTMRCKYVKGWMCHLSTLKLFTLRNCIRSSIIFAFNKWIRKQVYRIFSHASMFLLLIAILVGQYQNYVCEKSISMHHYMYTMAYCSCYNNFPFCI